MTSISPEAADRIDDVFDSIDPIERDRPWGRPLLVPGRPLAQMPLRGRKTKAHPEGVTADGKIPYTRASTLGDYVADHTALEIWRRRSLTYGLAQREDLQARAASCPPIISNLKNPDTLSKAEKEQDRLTNALLDEVAEEAERYANVDFKADWGTAIHRFTDPGPHGDIPERMKADVASFEQTTAHWQFHATEVFTANDELQSAGSFDHIVTIRHRPDLGALVVDKKTGLAHPDGWAIQEYSYASGEGYDPWTNKRFPLEQLTGGIPINTEKALIVHIPLGLGTTRVYLIDLLEGQIGAQIAIQVRGFRQRASGFMEPVDFIAEERLIYAGKVSACASFAELKAVRQEGINIGIWVPDLQALAEQKRSEFAS